MNHDGYKIRAIRLTRNMSVIELAEKLGISPSYLSIIESGSRCSSRYVSDKAKSIFGEFDPLSDNLIKTLKEAEKLSDIERHLLMSLLKDKF